MTLALGLARTMLRRAGAAIAVVLLVVAGAAEARAGGSAVVGFADASVSPGERAFLPEFYVPPGAGIDLLLCVDLSGVTRSRGGQEIPGALGGYEVSVALDTAAVDVADEESDIGGGDAPFSSRPTVNVGQEGGLKVITAAAGQAADANAPTGLACVARIRLSATGALGSASELAITCKSLSFTFDISATPPVGKIPCRGAEPVQRVVVGEPVVCGDGVIGAGESCDGDSDAACAVAGSCRAPGSAGACTCCGDGEVQAAAGEECEADSDCAAGEACVGCLCQPLCGNGVLDPGEECDPGPPLDPGQCAAGCDANCRCALPQALCGDGSVNVPGETCDGSDDAACAAAGSCRPAGSAGECTCCGDGQIQQAAGEQCEADSDCVAGQACVGCLCQPLCGNGVLDPGEQCDPGPPLQAGSCKAGCTSRCACLPAVKAVLKCQGAIEKAGTNYVDKVLAQVIGCVDRLLEVKLHEERGGAPGDFTKALTACNRALTKASAQAEKRSQKIEKGCGGGAGGVSLEVLRQAASGLGFSVLEPFCRSVATTEELFSCVADLLDRIVGRAVSKLKPRACELLEFALSTEPCAGEKEKGCLGDVARSEIERLKAYLICPTGQGGSEPLGATASAKAIVKCQAGIAKAGLTYLKKATASLLNCADKRLDPALEIEFGADKGKGPGKLRKALDACDKEIGKIAAAEGKKIKAMAKACRRAGKEVDDADLLNVTGGLGFENLTDVCLGEHGIELTGFDTIVECIDRELLWFAARQVSVLKPRVCDVVDEALAEPQSEPDPKKGRRPGSLEDSSREFLTALRPHLICACGGEDEPPCPAESFCEFPEGTCGAAGVPGMCIEKPRACTAEYDPVCGCDGTTYGNDCERRKMGVSKEGEGECE